METRALSAWTNLPRDARGDLSATRHIEREERKSGRKLAGGGVEGGISRPIDARILSGNYAIWRVRGGENIWKLVGFGELENFSKKAEILLR